MSAHMQKAVSLAAKIEAKADAILAPLDMEMKAMNWPPEYQQIMWDALLIAIAKRMTATHPASAADIAEMVATEGLCAQSWAAGRG